MATATVLDLITASLRKIGVHVAGQPVPPEDAQDALDELNRLLETWSLQGRLVPCVSDLAFLLTPGQASYTVGVGGHFSTPRPVTLHDGYTRVGSQDYPYSVIPVEVYAGIGGKSQGGMWPEVLYYEATMPLGRVHLWPVPTAAAGLHLLSDAGLSQVHAVTDLVSLPPGYRDGLIYALGKRLAPEYGRSLPPDFLAESRQVELWIQRHNTRPVIAEVVMPGGVYGGGIGGGGGAFAPSAPAPSPPPVNGGGPMSFPASAPPPPVGPVSLTGGLATFYALQDHTHGPALNRFDVSNVKAPPFNAVGNGVADDAAAFQAAMNAGKPVYVPAGTYKIGATLTNTHPVHLFGPFSPVLGAPYGALLKRAFSGHLFAIRGPMLMENLLLDDDGAGSSTRLGAALYLAANYDGGGNVLNNEAPSGSCFTNVRITSTNGDSDAWQYCVHADGAGGFAGGTAPPLRRLMFLHCQFFTGRTPSKTVWLDRVAHVNVVGGLINPGGASVAGGFTVSDPDTADVHFTGHEVIGNGVVADACEGFSFVGGRLGFSNVTTSLVIAAGTLGWVSTLLLGDVTNNAPNTCGVLYMNPVRNVTRMSNALHVESHRANYLALAGNTTGNAPSVVADGADSTIHLQLRSKGAGVVAVNTVTGAGTGGFQVGDASGVATFYVLPTGVINRLNNLTTQITAFNGNPNGNVVGSLGAICLNTAGGAGVSFYVKESGGGTNTGWVAK